MTEVENSIAYLEKQMPMDDETLEKHIQTLIDALKNSEEKTGYWKEENNPNYSPFDPNTETVIYSCSNCWEKSAHSTKYCSYCGAKMRKADYYANDWLGLN